jgi:hypothetical protein
MVLSLVVSTLLLSCGNGIEIQIKESLVDVTARSVPVSALIDCLGQRMEIKVIDPEKALSTRTVSVDVRHETARQAIEQVLIQSGLQYALGMDKSGASIKTLVITGNRSGSSGQAERPAVPGAPAPGLPPPPVAAPPAYQPTPADPDLQMPGVMQAPPEASPLVAPDMQPAPSPPPIGPMMGPRDRAHRPPPNVPLNTPPTNTQPLYPEPHPLTPLTVL